ncbi:hypothetical protein SVEN_3763 [Streptomyces venezuelae ATCC 10712]|uniref:Uncharacterized protein n=1 Tax=Streptomyces venezuelae (strain ATCC 10712 / CBS 650.69 / DSM 40230 / JCM 4526 / NBRC 13096 / PD 04745) TaxID=953739 RepID=F2REC6_STRVP|nr:hypothetical protein SVEN_3763 [Streptomyces venezuelae ATCC 10712]
MVRRAVVLFVGPFGRFVCRFGTAEAPALGAGASVGAEAEGFEPSMGFKTQTALAVRRHRPD